MSICHRLATARPLEQVIRNGVRLYGKFVPRVIYGKFVPRVMKIAVPTGPGDLSQLPGAGSICAFQNAILCRLEDDSITTQMYPAAVSSMFGSLTLEAFSWKEFPSQ